MAPSIGFILANKPGISSNRPAYSAFISLLTWSSPDWKSTHRARLINLKGENIDEGIKPDYQLDNTDDFFDIPKIGNLIEQFYAK